MTKKRTQSILPSRKSKFTWGKGDIVITKRPKNQPPIKTLKKSK